MERPFDKFYNRSINVMSRSQDPPKSFDLPISPTLCYNSAIPLYWISTSFLEERSPTRLKSTSFLEDYLQINAFLASSNTVEKNLLQLKATENQ